MTIRECRTIKAEGEMHLLEQLEPTSEELFCGVLDEAGRGELCAAYNAVCDDPAEEVETVARLPSYVTEHVGEWFIDTGIVAERELVYRLLDHRETEYVVDVETSTMARHYTVFVLGTPTMGTEATDV